MKKSTSQIIKRLHDRFEHCLLSVDRGYALAGRKTKQQLLKENSEQKDARRELLSVEEVAHKERERQFELELVYQEHVEKWLHREITFEIARRLSDVPELIETNLRIDGNFGKLTDTLFTEACTISGMVKHIDRMPWLSKSLIQYTSQRKYHRKDSNGQLVIFDSLRPALSFLGIENCRVLLPVLMAKHLMPAKTEYFPQFYKYLWMYTIGSGNVAKVLAERFSVRPNFGFVMGLFSVTGRSLVATTYSRVFDDKLKESLIDCRIKNDLKKAAVLNSLLPSTDYFAAYLKKYSSQLTYEVVEKLALRWIMIKPGFEDLCDIKQESFKQLQKNDIHPLALVLFKSQGFMRFKVLQACNLINREESMLLLHHHGIDEDDMAMLSKINLTGLTLKMSESSTMKKASE